MKFFMPDWVDKVDPGFDFSDDTFSRNRDLSNDVYAHEIFNTQPYDGILVSRAVAEKSKRRYGKLVRLGARKYYRLNRDYEVFGDCGAFSYVNEPAPWYETEDVLEYYRSIGVDYGVSVDHLVVSTIYVQSNAEEVLDDGTVVTRCVKKKIPMSEKEAKRRVELTLKNADEFIRLHRRKRYKFTPVGVAQGWSPETYSGSVRSLLGMGYSYIALGGLARSRGSEVLRVLNKIHADLGKVKSENVRFHLFGVAKLNITSKLKGFRVTSIDSASYLRKAWLKSGQNYLSANGEWFTAIRIPQSSNPRLRKFVKSNRVSMRKVRSLEKHCLEHLQKYSDDGLAEGKFDRLLDDIIEYDNYLLRNGEDGVKLRDRKATREKYKRTLVSRPWDNCRCEVCKKLGVHVLIFRGLNRNKRRGFHNTWTFHRMLNQLP